MREWELDLLAQREREALNHFNTLYINRPKALEIVEKRCREDFQKCRETGSIFAPVPEYTEEERSIMVQEAREAFILLNGYDPQSKSHRFFCKLWDYEDWIEDNIWLVLYFVLASIIAGSLLVSIYFKWFGI
jgi:hypothetical protein